LCKWFCGQTSREFFCKFVLSHRGVLRIIFIFLLKILYVKDFAFFFLLSRKKEEKCSQKEERKTVVDF